jgi:hypothetical protein
MAELDGTQPETARQEDRRKFLAACGRFAAVTPPMLTLLVSTSVNTDAIAKSGGGMGSGDHGHGHGRGGRPGY